MITVCKEKQLNGFKPVCCVKPKDLYSRLGHRVPDTNFNSSDEPLPMSMNKIDAIEYMDDYDRMMNERENVSEVQENNDANHDSPADET